MNEPADWKRWFDEHAAALVLLARQHCVNRADAEDAVQEAFVKAWERRELVDDPAAYLFAVVRTAAIDLSRRRKRAEKRDAQAPRSSDAQLESTLESDEWRVKVEVALKSLPPEQRDVLVMKIWGRLTFARIASALHIPANTAASRYRYALEALRGLL